MKMPAFQFYPADWRKDIAVQSLGYYDRGVWFEMLCLMHESSERGVLLLNGNPMSEEQIARLLGLDNQSFNQTLTTLLTYGVAKRRQPDNAIFSKRMVADEKLCESRRIAGKLGGNPALLNQNPTIPVNQNPPPSSSSSSSSSSSKRKTLSSKPDLQPAPEALEVLNYLNEKAGRNFQPGKENIPSIEKRIKKYSVDICKAVIDFKIAEWKHDLKMSKYLRPKTLFGEANFDEYAGQISLNISATSTKDWE